jgi:hypothetical protein
MNELDDPTVIRIERRGAEKFECTLFSRLCGENPKLPSELDLEDLSKVDDTAADVVQTSGDRIFQALCHNLAINDSLKDALKAQSDALRAIYIDADTVIAEKVRWETLWERNNSFLALDARWPVARRAGADRPPWFVTAQFSPPLRILAVISAENYPGEPEWKALCDAARVAWRVGLAVEICVVTGEAELARKIEDGVRSGNLTSMSVHHVPETKTCLDTLVGAFKPHLLHFFCHGGVDQGGWLQIRTGLKNKPFQISIAELIKLSSLKKVWLVVLNSCDSSVPIGEAPSMAYQLVTKVGVPVAIGTMEPVDVQDAYDFSAAFYQRLLYKFAENFVAAPVGERVMVYWTQALHAAREALDARYEKKSTKCRQWALPVLYERREQLAVAKAAGAVVAEAPPPAAPVRATEEIERRAIRADVALELLRALSPEESKAIKERLVQAVLGK